MIWKDFKDGKDYLNGNLASCKGDEDVSSIVKVPSRLFKSLMSFKSFDYCLKVALALN